MKNSQNQGFDQHYNAQVLVGHESRLILATSLSNHPNDQRDALPTVDALDPQLSRPQRLALDNGYFSQSNIDGLLSRNIDPYIATGRQPHHQSWAALLESLGEPPADDASAQVKMAYKLKTEAGKAMYRLRKCTVEPVIGIIKEVMGFRQFYLRGIEQAEGEWVLVCLAYNLKRLNVLISPS